MSPMKRALAALALMAVCSAPLRADEVRFTVRVDEQGQVFVDVDNATAEPIRVTSFVLRFFGAHDQLLDRSTSDCSEACTVSAGTAAAFGPFEAPGDWETVRVEDVFYQLVPATAAGPGPEAAAPAQSAPTPTSATLPAVAAAPPVPAAFEPAATPEAALREVYKWLVRGDYDRARQGYTEAGRERVLAALGEAGFADWARQETKGGTVVDVRLLEAATSARPQVRAEIRYADDTKAVRRVRFLQEQGGWKIDGIEEAR